MKNKYSYLLGALLCLPTWLMAQVVVQSPVQRAVYQRNNANQAVLPIKGSCPANATRIEARLIPRVSGIGTAVNWTVIDMSPVNGTFKGQLTMTGGWYDLEVRAVAGSGILTSSLVERVGAGEVFVICGHSVAQGDPNTIAGAEDDRVSAIPLNDPARKDQYDRTAKPEFLPTPGFAHYGTGVAAAPFGYNAYFWGQFGDNLARRLNVPVLIFNAAFGGTSLEHWALSSQGQPFEHGFVNASIGMPYVNLKNALLTYIKQTGVRAILSDQGQNDTPQKAEDILLNNYKTWVNQARTDLGFGQLACVVNRATPYLSTNPQFHIRRVQERMIATPHCFAGPDYDAGLDRTDRYDNIHLALSGQMKAARLWADALTDAFFARSVPYLPLPVPFNSSTSPATTPTPETNPNPNPQPQTPLVVTAPTYDCETGGLTINTTGGGTEPKEYMIEGLGTWKTSPNFILPASVRLGVTLTLRVRQAGVLSTFNFTTRCGTTTTAPVPPLLEPSPVTNTTNPAQQTTRLEGELEGADCGRVWGWAANRNDLTSPVWVWIFIDGQLAGTLEASALRTDIGTRIGGNGRYGFSFVIPQSFQTPGNHAVEARFSGGMTPLTKPTATYLCDMTPTPSPNADPMPSPEPAPQVSVYGWPEGKVESVDCQRIRGWAADLNQSYTAVSVDIYLDGKLAGTTVANLNRPDLATRLMDNGLHGFDWEIPQALRKEGARSVVVRFANSQQLVDSVMVNFACGLTGRLASEPVQASWSLYPNPVEDHVTLTIPTLFDPQSVQLSLVSLQGNRFVIARGDVQVSGQTIRIPVQSLNLQAGVYLLSISNDAHVLKTLKVLKK